MKNRIKSMLYDYIENIYSPEDIRELLMIIRSRADFDEKEYCDYNIIRGKIENLYRSQKEDTKKFTLSKHARIKFLERFWLTDRAVDNILNSLKSNTNKISRTSNNNFKIETTRFTFIINRDYLVITVYERKSYERLNRKLETCN